MVVAFPSLNLSELLGQDKNVWFKNIYENNITDQKNDQKQILIAIKTRVVARFFLSAGSRMNVPFHEDLMINRFNRSQRYTSHVIVSLSIQV